MEEVEFDRCPECAAGRHDRCLDDYFATVNGQWVYVACACECLRAEA